MADQIITLPPDGVGGRKLDVSELVVGSNTVERERLVTADPTDALGLAKVLNVSPVGTEYGQVVRLAGTAVVSGTVGVSNFPVTQPVSLTTLPSLPAGTNVIGHVIADAGSTTVVSNFPASQAVTGAFWQATQPVSLSALPTLPAGTNVIGHVIADAGSTTAVSNFPATQPVTGPLTDAQLRASTVPISGSVGVTNFPATQPVSGTVTVANPTANPETGLAKDASLPAVVGTWDYRAGVSGSPRAFTGRVVGIAAHATTAGSFTINGGDSVPVPAGASIAVIPSAQLVSPTLVFSANIDSFFVEFVA